MITTCILLQLLSNAVTLRRDKSVLYSRTCINIILYCIYSNYYTIKIIKSIGLFGGLFHATSVTNIFHTFFYIISGLILQLTAYYPRKIIKNLTLVKASANAGKLLVLASSWMWNKKAEQKNIKDYISFIVNKMAEQFKILEYSLIILFIISGGLLLMSTSDLISMFLSIELQSYGLYILSTIYKNSELATRGGLTYFLLGGLSSCFILLGSSFLYTNTATTNLDGIYVITSLSASVEEQISVYDSNYINISLIIMTAGFLFKVSAAPFHFWSPDVYDAIPTVVTTFVAIVAKISIFIFLMELLHYTGRSLFALEFTWINSLLVSCLLSLIIGTVLGLSQNRIKRLFAYSTISQIGFILLALSIDSVESIQAFLFYLMQYSLSNLNAFIILISIGYCYYLKINENKQYELLDQNNSPIQLTKQIKGLFYLNPVLALSLTITIFSFLGIPPLIGFFAKQMVLSAALDSGYFFLTIIAILTSVISAVYYLNIIREIFFYPEPDLAALPARPASLEKQENHGDLLEIKDKISNNSLNVTTDKAKISVKNHKSNEIWFSKIVLSSYLTITISVLTLGILLFIFVPKQWLSITNILALNLNNT